MKASELIKQLKDMINEHGDLHVCYQVDGFGGHSHNMIDGKIEVQKTFVSDEGGEAEDIIKNLKLDVQPDESFRTFVCTGTMLYCS